MSEFEKWAERITDDIVTRDYIHRSEVLKAIRDWSRAAWNAALDAVEAGCRIRSSEWIKQREEQYAYEQAHGYSNQGLRASMTDRNEELTDAIVWVRALREEDPDA